MRPTVSDHADLQVCIPSLAIERREVSGCSDLEGF